MKLVSRFALALTPVIVAVGLAGCSVGAQKKVAKAAVDTSSESQRKNTFEATAQLIDERPELVDELYGVMRLHPKAMDRFLADASTDLDQKWIAKNMAGYLVKNPAGVEEVMNAAIPAVAKEPKARAAMNRALSANSDVTSDILTDDAQTMSNVVKSLLKVTEKKPAARKNLLTAIHNDREAILAFVRDDKPLARAIAVEFVREVVKDKPTLEKLLASTGALDTPEGAPTPAPPAKAKGQEPKKPDVKPSEPPATQSGSSKPVKGPDGQKQPPGGGPTPPPVLGK